MNTTFRDRHQYIRHMVKLKPKYSFKEFAQMALYNSFVDRSDTKILWMDKLKQQEKQMLPKLFNFLQQLYYEVAYFNGNKNTFLKNVSSINFPALKELHLFCSKIESVEPLLIINAPLIQQLFLRNNQIIQIKALRKFSTSKLQILSLSGNQIKSFTDLSQLDAKYLQVIGVDFFLNLPDQDLSIDWVFKLSSERIKRLHLRKRKKLTKCEKMLRKKHIHLVDNNIPLQ